MDDPTERMIIVIAGGRVDRFLMRAIVPIVRRTWIRWTRHTPQKLARVMMFPYLVGEIIFGWLSHQIGAHPDWFFIGLVIPLVCLNVTMVDWMSRRLASLSTPEPDLREVIMAAGIAKARPWLVVFYTLTAALYLTSLSAQSYSLGVADLSLVFAWASLTIARPMPPKKKERQPFRIRLPRLMPAGV